MVYVKYLMKSIPKNVYLLHQELLKSLRRVHLSLKCLFKFEQGQKVFDE